MSSLPGYILWFIVAISVLVAVHEYGHYIVGRWCGMKVLRFSIGFGKPLWTWTGKDPDRTEFCISAIPVGGYVKFLDEREGPIDPADQGRAFTHRPIPARIAVLLAGPMFNFLFAIATYWVLFVQGVPAYKPVVGEVEPAGYAATAGLSYGDQIVSVGDQSVPDWQSVIVAMIGEMTDNGRIPLRVEGEDGVERQMVIDVGDDSARLTEPGVLLDGLGFGTWEGNPVIAEVVPDSPAAAAGLQQGDRLYSIDGEPVNTFRDPARIVEPLPGAQIQIEYIRDDRRETVPLRLGTAEVDGKQVGRMGVKVGVNYGDFRYLRKYELGAAVGEAINETWATTAFTVSMLGKMLTGDVSIKNISGPITIAKYAGETAAAGIDRYIRFLALISISLGVLNLLPVPILDGGQIVYQLVEAIKGSPLSDRSQIIGQQFGILALLLLMSFAFFNDFVRIFS